MVLIHGKKIGTSATYPFRVFLDGHENGTLEMASIHAFPREKYDNDGNGFPIYMGFHRDASATISATDWTIVKATYTSQGFIVERQILEGAWNNRTGLAWSF